MALISAHANGEWTVDDAYGYMDRLFEKQYILTEDIEAVSYTHLCEKQRRNAMTFFSSTIDVLQTLVIALGGGLGVWGVINLLEGYGNDNPGAKSQGIKQLMAGGGMALIGTCLLYTSRCV